MKWTGRRTSLFNKQIALGINVLWGMVIFILCILPGDSMPDPDFNIPHLDKVVHFGMFFIQTILLYLWAVNYTSFSTSQIGWLSLIIVASFGAWIEVMQHYCCGRTGDVWDWIADIVGGLTGYLVAQITRNYLLKA